MLSDRLVHRDEFGPVRKRRLDLNVVDHLGDAVHALRPRDHLRAGLHQVGHRAAVAKGGVAIGTALIVPGDEAVVERIREASETFGGEVGISSWNGFAMARFCAQDAAALRADMMTVLGRASSGALPRLWLN